MDFAPYSSDNNSDNDSANDRPTLAYHRPARRKTRITIYLDDEVLDQFRALAKRYGTGYQTLINAALRSRLSGASGEPGWFV